MSLISVNQKSQGIYASFSSNTVDISGHGKIQGSGIYIPLYSYPSSTEWTQVAVTKQLFPGITFLTCINPSNGPGTHFDKNFASGIDSLSKAGIRVGGYVATDYGLKPRSDVMEEITKYKTWYSKIDGICFDEMKSATGKEEYYKYLTEFSKSLGFNFTVGNPGTDVSPTYLGTVDFIKIYEGSGVPDLSSLQGWHLNHDKKNFITIAYDVDRLNYTYLAEATKYAGLIYITNDMLPNPYDELPNYFFDLASFLNSSSAR